MSKKYASGFLGIISIAIMAILLILPTPVILLDILIAVNILFAVFILIVTLNAKKIENYSSLPKMILSEILLNLATTIAITRVILTKGPEFNGILVGLIASLVSSNGMSSAIISLAVFVSCLGVLLIIDKGAVRVAEVAARFTLDSIPVKTMAIDTELEAKTITEEEAAARKNAVNSESDFYNSFDGASKFISGNVKIMIIIFIITVVAGILVGTKIRAEKLNEAIVTYFSLAIGSFTFAIIPSFILSTVTGVAVRRLIKGT